MLQHLLSDLEIGNDTVFERPDCGDIARCAPEHAFGLDADGLDYFLAVVVTNRHHRGLI